MARYALEASLERESIRTFKSMLVCAKQFGADLFFEANEHSVTLRLLNTAQSAFLVFSLQRGFFTKYTVRTRRRHARLASRPPDLPRVTAPARQMAPGATASVKLHLKNITSIFRSTFGVERVWLQVATGGDGSDGCDPGDGYMRLQLMCASGLRKKVRAARTPEPCPLLRRL